MADDDVPELEHLLRRWNQLTDEERQWARDYILGRSGLLHRCSEEARARFRDLIQDLVRV